MKKLLSILAILLAFIGAQAQVTIILEAHNVWGEDDYSGYQLLLDADHTAFGSIIPETGPLSRSGDVDASVYAEFEYKVPEDADGSLTTSNMVLMEALRLRFLPAHTITASRTLLPKTVCGLRLETMAVKTTTFLKTAKFTTSL